MEIKDLLIEKILERGRQFDTYRHNWSWQGYITYSSGSGIGVECKISDRVLKSGIISHRHKYYNCWNTEKDFEVRKRMYAELIADNLLDDIRIITNMGFELIQTGD